MRGALYRARHQLREETDKRHKCHKIVRGLEFSFVDIDGITQRLESVEWNTHRQYQIGCGPIELVAENRHQIVHTVNEKIVVFKHAQNGEIHQNIQRGDAFLNTSLAIKALYPHATGITAHRGEKNQAQKTPIPPAIKHIAGNSHKQILPLLTAKHKPVEQKHQRQKQYELQRYKRHI